MKYRIRELLEEDLTTITQYEAVTLLNAPFRYQGADCKWFGGYLRNYENAIRCCIVDESGHIVSIILFSLIDFVNKAANVFLYICEQNASTEISKISFHVIVDFAAKNLHLQSLILRMYQDHAAAATDAGFYKMGTAGREYWYYLEMSGQEASSKYEIDAHLPSYCIDAVHTPAEKQHILEYFDRDMFHSISTNPAVDRIRSNIIISANMLLAYNQEFLGFIAFYANNATTREAYITSIVVGRTARHQGVGHALMDRCKNDARMCGMKDIRLEVNANNQKALSFYTSLGYSFDGFGPEDTLFLKLPL